MIFLNICSFMWPPCHKSIYFYLVNLLDWDYPKTKKRLSCYALGNLNGLTDFQRSFQHLTLEPTWEKVGHNWLSKTVHSRSPIFTLLHIVFPSSNGASVWSQVWSKWGESRGEDQASHKPPLTPIILLSESAGTFLSKWSFSHCG